MNILRVRPAPSINTVFLSVSGAPSIEGTRPTGEGFRSEKGTFCPRTIMLSSGEFESVILTSAEFRQSAHVVGDGDWTMAFRRINGVMMDIDRNPLPGWIDDLIMRYGI